MGYFYFDFDPAPLQPYTITPSQTLISQAPDAHIHMDRIVAHGIEHLTSMVTGNPTIYITRHSQIPLIGNPGFGIVDRGTNIIEIKPVTGCNLKCVYCSLSEGTPIKQVEYLIEPDYLVDELAKVVALKGLTQPTDQVEIHIAVHGEPFIYGDMPYLCRQIRTRLPSISSITVDTNGTLLTEKLIDQLADAGMTRINMSLDSLDSKQARALAGGRPYSVKRILELIGYLTKHPTMQCLVAPVWMQNINDDDIRAIVSYAKQHAILLGIQNYMNYKGGQELYENLSWSEFFKRLEAIQEELGYRVVLDFYKDFSIRKVKAIPKPFKKRQIITATIRCRGRHANQMIGVSGSRNIVLFGEKLAQKKEGDTVRARITRDKHNIFYGQVL